MKVININAAKEYPENYDFLTEQQQEAIETYFNDKQELANQYYEKHIMLQETREDYLKLYDHTEDILTGGKTALAVLGIKVEYNWKHDSMWHLTTRAEWQEYNGLSDDCCCGKKNENVAGYAAWPTPKTMKTQNKRLDDTDKPNYNGLISFKNLIK